MNKGFPRTSSQINRTLLGGSMKILILKRDKIGDLLLTTPMLAHVKAVMPSIEVHMLANDYNAWVVQNDPHIDRLWIYPRFKHGVALRPAAILAQIRQILALRRERFDVTIVAGGVVSPRAIARIKKIGAARTIAYCDGTPMCLGLTDPIVLPPHMHEVDLNIRLLGPLGIAPPSEPIFPVFRLPEIWSERGRAWLAVHGLKVGRYIVLGVNARRVKRKPTTDQILRWSKHFKESWGLDTVFVWQPGAANDRVYPGDDEIVLPVLAKNIPYLHPFSDPSSVMPMLGVVWNARCSIFPDGGIAHLAAASPGGVLSLFAETDVSPHPSQWGPRGKRVDYLVAQKSVSELSDDLVFARLKALLD